VGICLERSIEMVVAVLGVLKAGGGYVPLDPAYPKDRLTYMIKDASATILLTQQRLLNSLPASGARVLCLDSGWEAISRESDENLPRLSATDNLAYVIYTSGSTGYPKGVMIEHQQLLNYLNGIVDRLDITAANSFAMISTVAADLGNTVIFPSLCTGGCLHLISHERALDSNALADYFDIHSVAVLKIVPSHLAALNSSSHSELVMPRRLLILGGEPSRQDWVGELRSLAPDCTFVNHYGPTETTVGVLTYRVDSEFVSTKSATVPLGRPLPNTQIYILDPSLRPVPVGVKGEIYVGGAGLARGYLNHPDLTARSFIPDFLGESAGGRLYATGDLARYMADGNIEYLGRIDSQVKVRGFRVESREVEMLLARHPAVSEALVMSQEDVTGEIRLVGYIVSKNGKPPTADELKTYLRQQLAEYMVPSAYVTLERIPLTANGKVDRKALPLADISQPLVESEYVMPRTDLEKSLAACWAELLPAQRVGVHDNFFDLGGHSLIAMRVVLQIRESLGIDLPLRRLFESPTVASLAQVIESIASRQANSGELPMKAVPRDRPLPLSFGQLRFLFLDQLDQGTAAYNIPAAVRLTGSLNREALEDSLSQVVARHEVLRTTFQMSDSHPVQMIDQNAKLPLHFIDLTELQPEQRHPAASEIIKREAQRPFDLQRGPVIRALLVRLGEQEHLLAVTIHHIASDGWSKSILIKEVVSFYQAYESGTDAALEPLPVQYADYAVWQREWLSSSVYQKLVGYWKQKLESAPSLLEMPTDHPRAAVVSQVGAAERFEIREELVEKLVHLGKQEAATLFMNLLAAYAVLLYRYSRQTDLVIGIPIANRRRKEVEGLIGFFINTLVMRVDLSGEPSFREIVRRVKVEALGAYEHQDLPFEKLVEELQPDRSLSHSPIFQVAFTLQSFNAATFSVDGLELKPVESDSGMTPFDLTLSMVEKSEGLEGVFYYKTDLFDRSTIKRMKTNFKILLREIAESPEATMSELVEVLDEADRQRWHTRVEGLREARLQKYAAVKRRPIDLSQVRGRQT
jgi:amino acid adenylation domain-containing protein